MAKPSQISRLEALEQKRNKGDSIVFCGRIERKPDGSLTVYSDTSRNFLDGGEPERIIEVVPKDRAGQWLRELIRICPLHTDRMKRRRWAASSPVAIALMARGHREELIETRIADALALLALESGNPSQLELNRIAFMVRMAQGLGLAGIGPEVLPLCKQALNGPLDVPLLRELSDLHNQQTDVATATEYLKIRHSL